MTTMGKNCTQVEAKHYCAKKNQPEFILDKEKTNEINISLVWKKDNALCNSKNAHVHKISHELSGNKNQLKTTYTIFKDGKFKKNTVYHFVKK